MTSIKHTKLQEFVEEAAKGGCNSSHCVTEAGWTNREIATAVRRGELVWTPHGRLEVNVTEVKS